MKVYWMHWFSVAFVGFWCSCVGADNLPNDFNEHPDGFWFGTQSIICMKSKAASFFPRLFKRSASSSAPAPSPRRSSLRYIHRLLFYRGTVFEWGTGVRGYHVGANASVTDCGVTWERSPAGFSQCPVGVAVNFTLGYRKRFGPYNLLINNCHHFANRISKLLSEPTCEEDTPVAPGSEDGVVTRGEKFLWRAVNFVLSYVDPEPDEEPETETEPEADETGSDPFAISLCFNGRCIGTGRAKGSS